MELFTIILISLFIIIFLSFFFKTNDSKIKNFEEQLYKIAGFVPYKPYKVEFSKTIKKPDGIYFQYNNGCVLYSLINIGYLDEKHIPDSMKFYKNHNYSQDEKTYEATLIRILSLIDLAQLWINLGGIVPYKENGKEISLEEIKNKVFNIIKKSIDKEDKKLDDIKPALKIVGKNERFMTIIGNIPIKPIYLKDCEYSKDLEKLNLKSAIDKGYIKENDAVFCLNHFIVYKGIIIEESKKYYVFHDSMTNVYKIKKWESMEGSKIFYDDGIIHSPEDSKLLNLEETDEKTIGILKPLFL
jgi:hypothetical protein